MNHCRNCGSDRVGIARGGGQSVAYCETCGETGKHAEHVTKAMKLWDQANPLAPEGHAEIRHKHTMALLCVAPVGLAVLYLIFR